MTTARSRGVPDFVQVTWMRYVIVIVSLAFFIIWDGLYNHSEYLGQFLRVVQHGFHMIGLM
jgi:hypothetical protein